jgi:hypothetical protein
VATNIYRDQDSWALHCVLTPFNNQVNKNKKEIYDIVDIRVNERNDFELVPCRAIKWKL